MIYKIIYKLTNRATNNIPTAIQAGSLKDSKIEGNVVVGMRLLDVKKSSNNSIKGNFIHLPQPKDVPVWLDKLIDIFVILLTAFLVYQFGWNGSSEATVNNNIRQVVNAQSTIGRQEIYFMEHKDPNVENIRPTILGGLKGKALIQKWFDLMAEQEWTSACSLMSRNDCDISNWESVNSTFSFIKEKTENGYEDAQIQHSDSAPSNIWCVRYHYKMAQGDLSRNIIEIMQYKLSRRQDGADEISTKLCERQWKEGIGETKCVHPTTYYCLNLQW